MTPHGVLEDMAMVELMPTRAVKFWAPEVWGQCRMDLAASTLFDFAAAEPGLGQYEFGIGLLERGMFRLPYDNVFMTAQFTPGQGVLATNHIVGNNYYLRFCLFKEARNDVRAFSLPFLAGRAIWPLDGGEPNFWANWCTEELPGRMFGETTRDESLWPDAGKSFRFIVACVSMLRSKDIETSVVSPSSKLNKDRAAKGRPPLRDKILVSIKPGLRAAYAAAAEEFKRSSPTMHFRRGHFRTLPSGSVVPVAPSIVNASPDSKPATKAYEVTE